MFVCFEGLGEEAVDSPVSDFPFIPLDCDGQKDMARRLGKRTPTSNRYSRSKPLENLPNRRPLSCDNPEPDGNCLPRALSLAIYGKEDFFPQLRSAVCTYILKNVLPSDSKPRDSAFYKDLAIMRKDRTWMRDREIEAYCYLLDVVIYSCVEVKTKDGSSKGFYWQRQPHIKSSKQVNSNKAIYILNFEKHFYLVRSP